MADMVKVSVRLAAVTEARVRLVRESERRRSFGETVDVLLVEALDARGVAGLGDGDAAPAAEATDRPLASDKAVVPRASSVDLSRFSAPSAFKPDPKPGKR